MPALPKLKTGQHLYRSVGEAFFVSASVLLLSLVPLLAAFLTLPTGHEGFSWSEWQSNFLKLGDAADWLKLMKDRWAYVPAAIVISIVAAYPRRRIRFERRKHWHSSTKRALLCREEGP